ncbi:cupin domain-containing protein [Rubellicoccus peritrichatus]|uniref:Cupin domain-containing protein n=1 Tax=Rubellicoccus peritrichatus TaxID=3080537 RepID=A0AAQ3LBY3_9BACT|nr:cupin domain-containing protein [Puniceicoccus sp. CR14]WOO41739.1 cupin domain-containing protein [Puniceicoccus sp. CR14]
MKFIPHHDDGWIEGQGYRKQPLLLPADLNCDGALVQIVEIPPHTSCPLHHHNHQTEVFHIIEGEGRMTIGGKTVHLKPGDTVTTEPGERHEAINASDKTWRYVVFKTNWSADDSVW